MDSVSSFAGLRAPAPTASSSAGSSPPPSPMKKMATRGFGDKPPGLRKNSTVLGSFARKASVFARPGARPPIGGPGGPDRPKRSASVLAFSRPSAASVRRNSQVVVDRDTRHVPHTYRDTIKHDESRKKLLMFARLYSPIDLVVHFNKYAWTVLPRVLAYKLVWLILVVYAAVATLSRLGLLIQWGVVGSDEYDHNAIDGSSILIVFMIVFYVGYCYNRHNEQYFIARDCMATILNVCALARTTLKRPQDAVDLWRFLNLLHVAAYCGLTPTYNRQNLLDQFVRDFGLASSHGVAKRTDEVDVDHSGPQMYNECCVWALHLLHSALERRELEPEAFRTMTEQVCSIRQGIGCLYAYQFQVIPFAYSHLVSLSSFIYLLALAIFKGLRFVPDDSILFGLIFPLFSFWLILLSIVGLIEIGQAIANPWGNDPEDFAVPTFLRSTAEHSRNIISATVDPLGKDLNERVSRRVACQAPAAATTPAHLSRQPTTHHCPPPPPAPPGSAAAVRPSSQLRDGAPPPPRRSNSRLRRDFATATTTAGGGGGGGGGGRCVSERHASVDNGDARGGLLEHQYHWFRRSSEDLLQALNGRNKDPFQSEREESVKFMMAGAPPAAADGGRRPSAEGGGGGGGGDAPVVYASIDEKMAAMRNAAVRDAAKMRRPGSMQRSCSFAADSALIA